MTNKRPRVRQITIETHSITIIRATHKSTVAYCEDCLKKKTFFTLGQVAEILQITLAEVCHRLESGQFHLIRGGRSVGFICGAWVEEFRAGSDQEKWKD